MNTTNIAILKEKTDLLLGEFAVFMDLLSQLDKQKELVEAQDRYNRNFEKDLSKRNKDLVSLKKDLEAEKEYINKLQEDVEEKIIEANKSKDIIEKIEITKKELIAMREEERKQDAIITERIKSLSILQEKFQKEKLDHLESYNKNLRELDKKEEVIKKLEVIDRERKQLLDIREERIAIREKQLHIEQQE